MTSLQQDHDQQPASGPADAVAASQPRAVWLWVALPALAGVAFTTVQIMERIDVLAHPGRVLFCDVNAQMSCSNVLAAWQSSVLGPPNALIGAVMFSILGCAGLAGLLGSRLSRPFLITVWGLAVFFLCFASWFMFQTAFSIVSLCVWCTGIVTAVVIICAALTRIASRAEAFGSSGFGYVVRTAVHSRLDLAFWAVWWLAIAAMLWVGLYA